MIYDSSLDLCLRAGINWHTWTPPKTWNTKEKLGIKSAESPVMEGFQNMKICDRFSNCSEDV